TAVRPTTDARTARWHAIMDEIAATSRAAYRALVSDDPRFHQYFRLATPIDVIERMPIGSRPPARSAPNRSGARRPGSGEGEAEGEGEGGGIAQLRAIPWVFAWTQSRHMLPGWFGLGTALEGALRRHGDEVVAEMLRDWPFLKALVDDVEFVLAEADLGIAARYARLAGSLEQVFFPAIQAEFDRTVSLALRLKGTSALLDEDPVLQRSIRLRNPYVDPISLLQA